MPDPQQPQPPQPSPHPVPLDYVSVPRRLVADYFWFVLKNVLGWILILMAWPVGLLVPGPGGIPIFLIGFALVTFPGKRSLTARVLHGTPVDLRQRRYAWVTLVAAAALPAAVFWFGQIKHYGWGDWLTDHHWALLEIYAGAFAISWVLAKLALRGLNVLLRYVPAVRRRVRPWLRPWLWAACASAPTACAMACRQNLRACSLHAPWCLAGCWCTSATCWPRTRACPMCSS